jgi:hypothetical protein
MEMSTQPHAPATLPSVPKNKRVGGPQSQSGALGKEKITYLSQAVLYSVKYKKVFSVLVPLDLNFGFLQGKSQLSMARVWEALSSAINNSLI